MKKLLFVSGIWLLLVAPEIARADDIRPPPWRGQSGSTMQSWEFSTRQENPIPPDGGNTLPSTMLSVYPGPGMDWMEMDAGRQGVWPLSGSMHVIVDNYTLPNPVKLMYVQLTWRPQVPGAVPILSGFDPAPDPATPPELRDEVPLVSDWRVSVYGWGLSPNPPDEEFMIEGNINVDELVIDTWCCDPLHSDCPEPATLSLLVLGGVAMLRRRR